MQCKPYTQKAFELSEIARLGLEADVRQNSKNACNADKAAFRVDVVNHSKQTQSGS